MLDFNSVTDSALPEQQQYGSYDLAFVGAGLSGAATLINYLQDLHVSPSTSPRRIVVFDRSPDFFKGIAYGDRSGNASLLINSLSEFLPDSERDNFYKWFAENKYDVLAEFRDSNGPFAAQWFNEHAEEIASNKIDLLYIPRYLFGAFLDDRVGALISSASRDGLATVQTVQVSITDIEPVSAGFTISSVSMAGEQQSWNANQVVLGLGSPPSRQLPRTEKVSEENNAGVVDDPFNPGLDSTMGGAIKTLQNAKPGQRRVIIVGSNASAVDALVNLANREGFDDCVEELIIVSPSGALPERYRESEENQSYNPESLSALRGRCSLQASDIMIAARADVSSALEGGVPLATSLSAISSKVFGLLDALDADELHTFVSHTGNAIGRLQRRTGDDYCNVVDILTEKGKLRLQKAKFLSHRADFHGAMDIHISGSKEGGEHDVIDNVSVIINCCGAEKLNENSSNPLINQLISRNLCNVNDSGIGFEVDHQMQANVQGLYVIGPMLAGNVVGKMPIWHAEHSGRIFDYSSELATQLKSTYPSAASATASDAQMNGGSLAKLA